MGPKTELFKGDGTAEKANVWLRQLEQMWKFDAKDDEKRWRFERALYPGSPAEVWYKALPGTDKTDWPKITAAFEKKWPPPSYTARENSEVMKDLKENVLEARTVGDMVEDEDGTRIPAHRAWAQIARRLVNDLQGGDPSMLLMGEIRATLPPGFCRLISEEATKKTWDAWFAAFEAISIYAINDWMAENRIERQEGPTATSGSVREGAESIVANLAHALDVTHILSPTRPRHRQTFQLSSTRIPAPTFTAQTPPAQTQQQVQQQRPMAMPTTPVRQLPPHMTGTSQWTGTTVRPSSAFGRDIFASPISPSAGRGPIQSAKPTTPPLGNEETARALTQTAHLYNKDAQSLRKYQIDFAAWQNGNQDVRVFPFSPGTLPPGSRECYRCGLRDPPHGAGSCAAPLPVPTVESNIRRWVHSVIYPLAKRGQCQSTPSSASWTQTNPLTSVSMEKKRNREMGRSTPYEGWCCS
ncbi:unnamed protein product [Mycena citricolor]|uniref:Gag protein n=1 Tax=Mycena citricolor TaxID=2018698 RepID=A0AAD2HJY8_9AGAR|nr:unnamed protein product [Mycena citricolor]